MYNEKEIREELAELIKEAESIKIDPTTEEGFMRFPDDMSRLIHIYSSIQTAKMVLFLIENAKEQKHYNYGDDKRTRKIH